MGGEDEIEKIEKSQESETEVLDLQPLYIGESEKTIDEIIFRTRFLDFVWGKSYFRHDPSDAALRQLFKNHLGLRIVITNRGLVNQKTRHRFMVNQLRNIERNILDKIK